MSLCNYCWKRIPPGFDLWWNQKPYHPDCAIQVAAADHNQKEKNTMGTANCAYCKENILATCQEFWKGRPYHELCLSKAIQEAYQPAPEALEDQFIDDDDFENFDGEDDFADDEMAEEDNFSDLTESDQSEVVSVSPITMPTNGVSVGAVAPVVMPEGATIAAPRAIIHPPQTAASPMNGGNLMLGTKGSRYVTRSELYNLPVPERTATWQPVPHYDFVRKLLDGLWDRRMIVTDEKYAASADGFKLYGLLTLQDEYNGVNYAVGLKNSNDKSSRLSLAVGYVVKVCTNGMLSGDYQPLTAKHTAKFNLEDSLSVGIDRIKRQFLRLNGSIERKRDFALTEGQAEEFVYKAFMRHKLPVSLLGAVHKELFVAPTYAEFKPLNLWSLENAFTTAFKKLQPTSQFEATSKLAKFMDRCLN